MWSSPSPSLSRFGCCSDLFSPPPQPSIRKVELVCWDRPVLRSTGWHLSRERPLELWILFRIFAPGGRENIKGLFYTSFKNIKHICKDFTILSLEETRRREPPKRWCKESQTRAGSEWRQWGCGLQWKWSFRKHGGGGGQLSRAWTLASFPLFLRSGETSLPKCMFPPWACLDCLNAAGNSLVMMECRTSHWQM